VDFQAGLSEEQEELRRDGLRILARIIARHYLEHPEQYADRNEAVAVTEHPRNQPDAAVKDRQISDRKGER